MWWTPWLWSFCISRLLPFEVPRASTCTRCAAGSPTARARPAPGRRGRCGFSHRSPPRGSRPATAPDASSTLTGSGGSCFTPRVAWAHEDVAAHIRGERAHDLAHRGREDVDPAHDQHVVGAPEAADARAGAAARARRRAHVDVVPGPEPEQRRGAVPEMGEDELARGPVGQLDRGARVRVDQLRVHEAAGAEVHAVLLLALAPERRADVADAHRLGHAGAPALLEPRAEGGLASSGLARRRARASRVDPRRSTSRSAAHSTRYAAYEGVSTAGLGPELLDREHQPLGVPRPDRDVTRARSCRTRRAPRRPRTGPAL